jgi:broad specificity phosphatase PhoE
MSDAALTTMLLIRHAQTDAVDSGLSGRDAVPLNQVGRAQAERLRRRLAAVNIAAVYSSPVDRALETAAGLAQERGLLVEPRLDLIEVNFGSWTGTSFDRLAQDPAWVRFNRQRGLADVPGGERAPEVQARVVRAIDELRIRHPNQTIALISHADVIRLAVLFAAGAPVDFIHRFAISPASVTCMEVSAHGIVLKYVNATGCQ